MNKSTSIWRYFDIWLLLAVVLLNIYGILMIRSAITGAPAFVGFEQQQMLWMGIGLVVMFIIASIDYRILTSAHWFIYAGLIGLLIIVTLIGTAGNEANRWIDLGFFNFQPSELGRVLIPVTLGAFVAARQDRIARFSNTAATLFYLGVPILFIFTQPDLGMSILYIVIWFGIMVVAGLPLSHFVALGVIGFAAIVIAYPNLAEYQQARITSFIDPESDLEQSRNITAALVAIGSGGWWGKGYFNGTQSQLGFLRVQHTDFIFSVVTEEMGFFFGALIVLGLMAFILLRILRVASITPDPAGRYICVGIATMLFFQTLVSVGMNTRLLPVTGLTLPFVSYGGSALVTLYIAIGLVQSVLMRHRKQEFG
jgi:rod shape determining protein RodA